MTENKTEVMYAAGGWAGGDYGYWDYGVAHHTLDQAIKDQKRERDKGVELTLLKITIEPIASQ